MHRLSLSLCLVFSFATTTLAQEAKPVDPAALAQARIVFERSNAGELGLQVARAIEEQQRAALERFNPARVAQINEVVDLVRAEYAKYLPALMDAIVTLYAQRFTADELAQVAAFYDTPVGRKMIREMPALLSETMSVAQTMALKATTEVMIKLRPEIEKRNLKLGPSAN
jgi:hypothetical protein